MSATAMTAQSAPLLEGIDEARVWVAARLDVDVPETLTDRTVAQIIALRYPGGTQGWVRERTVPSRSYVVGLPVVVTVADDGTVTYEVDTSEAGTAIADEHDAPGDVAAVEADHEARRAPTRTRNPRRDLIAVYDVMDGRYVVNREAAFTTARTERTGLDALALDTAAMDADDIGYEGGVVLRDVLDAATRKPVAW